MANCRICNGTIDCERLERWPWCVTCSPRCSDANSADARRRASREYKRRRRGLARMESV